MMIRFLEQLFVGTWNRLRGQERGAWPERGGLDLGYRVSDGQVTRAHVSLGTTQRAMHMAVLGKTGSGKSSLLRYLAQQDIAADRGFLYFDLHGDTTPFLLKTINARERRERRHLSDKLVIIEPADPIVSVGLNPLEQQSTDFVRIAEFAQVLRERWHLDSFGARTDELLRNSLFVLSANGLTLVELAPFLTHTGFRAACLKRVENAEVRQYFELRYDQQSEAMRATMREPILNKTSAFTADPHFRHIVGQASTFSMKQALDEGYWVIVNLEKGRLGAQALTLGSLILTVLKNALFTREKRSLFTVYADEIQNLVAYGSGIETMLSEARKFGVGVVSANQFLDQYPAEMRAAILSVNTHMFFQLSSADATQVSQALDGGKPLAERLKNLSQRHAIVKIGGERWVEVAVPTVREPDVDSTDLLNRSRLTKGRARVVIERAIAKRQATLERSTDEVLHEWD
jgi:energy-coupling factor transporter ATP-binding protein EcfA2